MMTIKSKRASLAACLSAVIAYTFAADVGAQNPPLPELPRGNQVLQNIDRYKEAIGGLEKGLELDDSGRNSVQICTDKFIVRLTDEDPHLNQGDEFLITGPIPGLENYQIVALPPHEWRGPPKTYSAIPTANPDWFDIDDVIVEPHNGMPLRVHRFKMQVIEWGDGGECPDWVIFWFQDHVPSDASDSARDPGHAVAGRG